MPLQTRTRQGEDDGDKAPKKTIWDIALEERNKDKASGPSESHVLFVGQKGSGKTTMIQKFKAALQGQDDVSEPKPTSGLQYLYVTKKAMNGEKLANLWELGGGDKAQDLLDVAIRTSNVATLKVVLVVDLQKPSEVFDSCEKWMMSIQKRVQAVKSELAAKGSNVPHEMEERHRNVFGSHPDMDHLHLSGVPLLVVGSKFDALKNAEPSIQDVVSNSLRFMAHSFGGSILFWDHKDSKIRKSFFDPFMKDFAFDEEMKNKIQVTDVSRGALAVSAGADSLNTIKAPGTGRGIDGWRAFCHDSLPGKVVDAKPEKKAVLNFAQNDEPEITAMRKQKDEELEHYRKQSEQKYQEYLSGLKR
eukprot:GFYU01006554.1.p1 GENE.GFYU01006554.1~~GFYU01006554.1.p1  ORF type:complete len:360 (-),score=93.82 GFYU01006554.1:75-1154(-)